MLDMGVGYAEFAAVWLFGSILSTYCIMLSLP